MKRILFAVFSIAGTAVLGWLGNWQLDRLAWKQTVLEQIDQRIAAPAVPVPLTPVPSEDTYLPVFAEGRFGQEYIRVLVSQKRIGAGYRVISAFKTEGASHSGGSRFYRFVQELGYASRSSGGGAGQLALAR